MKLLLVSESYWPNLDGGAVFQRRLVHGLAQRGHQVVVWAPGQHWHSYQEKDGDTLIYRERSFPAPGNSRYRFSLWPFWHAYQIVRRERPDLIHVHAPSQIALAAVMAAKRYKIPVVATNHVMPENLVSPKLPPPLFRLTAGLIWRYIIWFHNRTQYVTTPSPTALRYLQQHHLKPPAKTISNGLELAIYKPSKLPKTQPPTLLYVGRIDPEKNLATLVRAVAILKPQTDFQLDIVGTGTQVARLKQLAVELNIQDIVHFRGRLSDTDKLKAYQSASVFVIASPAELQSIVTLEAMACGLPVVAADAGALPDLVANDETGFTVSANDPQAYATACLKLLTDTPLRNRLGQNALELIQTHHATERTFDAYEQLYQQVLTK
jgi:glycosyltransferase involved in cell wall biosynthesis